MIKVSLYLKKYPIFNNLTELLNVQLPYPKTTFFILKTLIQRNNNRKIPEFPPPELIFRSKTHIELPPLQEWELSENGKFLKFRLIFS
jgi:hypothetical protein